MAQVPVLQAQAAFLKWMRENQPASYQAVVGNAQLSGFWDTVSKTFSTVSQNVAKLGTAYVEGKAAYELMKANIKRAKSGLLPANSLDEVNALDPYGSTGFGGIPQWAIYAGVGLVAFLIIRRR